MQPPPAHQQRRQQQREQANQEGQLARTTRTPEQQAEFARVQLSKAADKLARVMPKHSIEPGRFMQMFYGMMQTADLVSCTMPSLLVAAYNCAKLGLMPDPLLGQVYIVPYNNTQYDGSKLREAAIIIGYKGMVLLARRSGQIGAVRARVVYENDEFDYSDGLEVRLVHRPYWMRNQAECGKRFAAYVVADILPAGKQPHVIHAGEVEARRLRSRAATNQKGPWVTDIDAMWMKSAVRSAAPMWPQSPELMRATALEDVAEEGASQVDEEAAQYMLGDAAAHLAPGTHFYTRPTPRPPAQAPRQPDPQEYDQQGEDDYQDGFEGGSPADPQGVQPQTQQQPNLTAQQMANLHDREPQRWSMPAAEQPNPSLADIMSGRPAAPHPLQMPQGAANSVGGQHSRPMAPQTPQRPAQAVPGAGQSIGLGARDTDRPTRELNYVSDEAQAPPSRQPGVPHPSNSGGLATEPMPPLPQGFAPAPPGRRRRPL